MKATDTKRDNILYEDKEKQNRGNNGTRGDRQNTGGRELGECARIHVCV